MRVLLVEDDDRLGAALSDVLRVHGMEVDHVNCARLALEHLTAETDAVVLDLGLPDRDGFEVCSRIRRTHDVPILIATARSDLTARVHGLNLGADDYLVKPYDVRELMARLHAISRRRRRPEPVLPPDTDPTTPTDTVPAPRTSEVSCGDVVIDVDRRSVTRLGSPVQLTRKEFDLLALLAVSPGWCSAASRSSARCGSPPGTLPPHPGGARRCRPGEDRDRRLIETVRGVGYRLAAS